MRRRTVPNAISKRFRRKLRRVPQAKQFLFYLKCKRPRVYARLTRFQMYQFIQMIVSIDPWKTPFLAMAPKVRAKQVAEQWRLDEAQAVGD